MILIVGFVFGCVQFAFADESFHKAIDYVRQYDNREYTDMSYVAVYSPIQYIPQAIGIGVSRIFTDNILIMAYFSKDAILKAYKIL